MGSDPIDRFHVRQLPLEHIAPDFEGVTKIEHRKRRPAAVGLERTEIGPVDLFRRPPAAGRGSAKPHGRRAKRQVAHFRAVLPDEAAKQLKVAEHSEVERVISPSVKARPTEKGRRMRRLHAEAEHPGTEEAPRAVPHRRPGERAHGSRGSDTTDRVAVIE